MPVRAGSQKTVANKKNNEVIIESYGKENRNS